jgi:hypothetical protein
MAGFARESIQLNEGGNARGIHPLNLREVECDGLPAHQRRNACNKIALMAEYKFGKFSSAPYGENLCVILIQICHCHNQPHF